MHRARFSASSAFSRATAQNCSAAWIAASGWPIDRAILAPRDCGASGRFGALLSRGNKFYITGIVFRKLLILKDLFVHGGYGLAP
jgi:hypothetical protein